MSVCLFSALFLCLSVLLSVSFIPAAAGICGLLKHSGRHIESVSMCVSGIGDGLVDVAQLFSIFETINSCRAVHAKY